MIGPWTRSASADRFVPSDVHVGGVRRTLQRLPASRGPRSPGSRSDGPIGCHCTRFDTIATALGARLDCHLEWRGEGLDRLLDAAHARLVEAVVRWLDVVGWESAVEVSFSIYGERGSIDILALHRPTGSILVIEIKTVVPDIQAMLSALDRKARLAIRIAHDRGWPATRVSRLLVVREDRTARRRVQAAEATFRHAFPDRLVPLRAFIRSPEGREPISGLMFLPDARQPVTRHRVGQSKGRSVA